MWWAVDMPKPDWALPEETYILESDGGKRGDAHKIREKKIDEAEVIKHRLEEVQRRDKQLRTAAKERRAAANKQ